MVVHLQTVHSFQPSERTQLRRRTQTSSVLSTHKRDITVFQQTRRVEDRVASANKI